MEEGEGMAAAVPHEQYPEEVTEWLGTVEAKIVEMFGASRSGEYTYEQEKAAKDALAAEGIYPPPGVDEWLQQPLKDHFNKFLGALLRG
jgi:hypothetical protein